MAPKFCGHLVSKMHCFWPPFPNNTETIFFEISAKILFFEKWSFEVQKFYQCNIYQFQTDNYTLNFLLLIS